MPPPPPPRLLISNLSSPTSHLRPLISNQVFDADGDGFISAFELGQALASMGESRTVEDLHEMIRAVDVNGDGQVRTSTRSLLAT